MLSPEKYIFYHPNLNSPRVYFSEAHERINMEQLSRKNELFQTRFIVHKARKLAGAIQQPLVRIHLDNKVLRTKPKKGKNPKWNEVIFLDISRCHQNNYHGLIHMLKRVLYLC